MQIALGDLNTASQKGLGEMFDGSIGAGSVLNPFGGKNQLTPPDAMVAKIPLLDGDTKPALTCHGALTPTSQTGHLSTVPCMPLPNPSVALSLQELNYRISTHAAGIFRETRQRPRTLGQTLCRTAWRLLSSTRASPRGHRRKGLNVWLFQ